MASICVCSYPCRTCTCAWPSRRLRIGPQQRRLLAYMQPGQWYDAAHLRTIVPGSSQYFYQILASLCAHELVDRQGGHKHLAWCRRPSADVYGPVPEEHSP